jgi:hypothetical protein
MELPNERSELVSGELTDKYFLGAIPALQLRDIKASRNRKQAKQVSLERGGF